MSELGETALLKLAARASGAGRLTDPHGSARIRNPFCGDRLTLDVKLADGVVTEIGYEIRACLVCQASTSIVGDMAVGQRVDALADIGKKVEDFLKQGAQAPDSFDVFQPVQAHKNRHVCVMMPFQGIAEAAEDAESN